MAYPKAKDALVWPGYDPRRLPLAIYDGRQTWLFRHPAPPPEFIPNGAPTEGRVFDGLHPTVRANTSAYERRLMAHLLINYSHNYNWLVRGCPQEDLRPVAPSSVRS